MKVFNYISNSVCWIVRFELYVIMSIRDKEWIYYHYPFSLRYNGCVPETSANNNLYILIGHSF